MEKYLPTGNEVISLPQINEKNAQIENFTFLHMGYKGLVDTRASSESALIKPFIKIDEKELELSDIKWERIHYWLPKFTAKTAQVEIEGIYFAPIEERGFITKYKITNKTDKNLRINYGISGVWGSSYHCVNEDKEITAKKYCYKSLWNDCLVFDMRDSTPIYSFAPMPNKKCESGFTDTNGEISYKITCEVELAPNSSDELTIYWGLGFEEVASATSAKEMLRQGFDYEFNKTCEYLEKRIYKIADKKLAEIYNTNLFFCMFFSSGITLDSEELVLITSTSPRYYVSAAYWDRDSFFWSFPAILQADTQMARDMLTYAFTRQLKNIGVHSRYIDGTVLEPGFELDELTAPVIALCNYVKTTGDTEILEEINFKKALTLILNKLAQRKAENFNLYSTFLQPTDDEHVYPYLTYNNVLVFKMFTLLAEVLPEYSYLNNSAKCVKDDILKHCVFNEKVDEDREPVNVNDSENSYFAWSVDLKGNHDVYDEPPGSLLLLPHLGFCTADNAIYKNTACKIRSPEYKYSFANAKFADIGCAHAPHPWLLSVANSILSGRAQHGLNILKNAEMDNGIACESIDENTGECTTGEAFATCAGFVCYAIRCACEENLL